MLITTEVARGDKGGSQPHWNIQIRRLMDHVLVHEAAMKCRTQSVVDKPAICLILLGAVLEDHVFVPPPAHRKVVRILLNKAIEKNKNKKAMAM